MLPSAAYHWLGCWQGSPATPGYLCRHTQGCCTTCCRASMQPPAGTISWRQPSLPLRADGASAQVCSQAARLPALQQQLLLLRVSHTVACCCLKDGRSGAATQQAEIEAQQHRDLAGGDSTWCISSYVDLQHHHCCACMPCTGSDTRAAVPYSTLLNRAPGSDPQIQAAESCIVSTI